MKKILSFSAIFFIAFSVFGQNFPEAFSYQAVIRKTDGSIIADKNVGVQISITAKSINDTLFYTENHFVKTNKFGLVDLEIGRGTVVKGIFANIDWSGNKHFIRVSFSENGALPFTFVGASELLSVPFANYAKRSGDALKEGNGIKIANGVVSNTGDLNNTNEIQSLSLTGNTLSISSGNTVILPQSQVGPQGAKGDTGSTGAAGAKGDTGDKGAKGDIGLTGANGAQGIQGTKGDKGDTGASGTNGAQGTQGIPGAKGDIGLTGQTGAQGAQGSQGVQGPAGTSGSGSYNAGTGISISGNTITNTGDDDNSTSNEIQTLSLVGNNLTISSGNTVALPSSGGSTYSAGTGLALSGTTFNNTGDLSSTNEIQTLSLTGNTLSITNGNSVGLPIATPYTAGTGIGVNSNVITNTGDLSSTNEIQALSISGSTLSLSNGGGSVTLPSGGGSNIWQQVGTAAYYNSGFVGIGTSSPSNFLNIQSNQPNFSNPLRDFLVLNNTATGSGTIVNMVLQTGSGGKTFLSHQDSGYGIAGYEDSGQLMTTGTSLILRNFSSNGIIKFETGLNGGASLTRMLINSSGNIGIGTTAPNAKLQVSDGDVYIDNATKGVIMKSPNGSCFRMTVSNTGTPVFTAITCP